MSSWLRYTSIRAVFLSKLVTLCIVQLLFLLVSVRLLYGQWPSLAWDLWLPVAIGQLMACAIVLVLLKKLLGWKKLRSPRIAPEIKAERNRIAQDLHDGVGTHLHHALTLLDAPSCSLENVRFCLSHAMWALRVEMEVLDDADTSLIERLATMRWRLEPLLQAKNVQLSWAMPTDVRDAKLYGEKARQLTMVVQEAISNALRHSQCRFLQVSLVREWQHWHLSITDDGIGLHMQAMQIPLVHTGRGLRNMFSRANVVGATLGIDTAPGKGCRITVRW